MCNCGKGRASAARPRTYGTPTGQTQQFSLVNRDGTTQQFGSRLEADAENARKGFSGIVKPVAS